MTENTWNLASLIERGGIHYNISGSNPKELLAGAMDILPPILSLDSKELYREILEREALMPTGVGRGIALPHPRNPLLGDGGEPLTSSLPLVALVFPAQPLDWNTQDGSKVHTVFLIVSSSAKQHLNTLSKINFLCQQEKFYSLIKARSSKEDIIAAIREAEAGWAGAL
ncbi:MAG: PTS sugar transporter subunit IIA [Treponema sp.]|nr:PTS sugar transporter subunit IIA [Treponema sp.]